MEKILVTGAGGYIGSHVVDTLLDMGYQVIAVDLKNNNINSAAKFLNVDIFSEDENLYEQLGSPDRIIHLAWRDGFVHNSKVHMEYLPKHYNFISSMVESGVKSISVMGSMHEVGYYEGAINEDTPTNPSSLYAISKNALRQSLKTLNLSTPFTFHWLRGYYILGDDTKNNSIFTKILQKAEMGEKEFPFTTGTNKYDFIDINDLALEIALSSVQDEVLGEINCCSGKPVALKDKVEEFIKKAGLEIVLKYGVFPERPYDSKIIYGDNTKIKQVLKNSLKKYGGEISARIENLISNME